MKVDRRNALGLLGCGIAQAVIVPHARAAPPTTYIDQYCYCGDILVSVTPDVALKVMASGDDHTLWASSIKREISPGLWVGVSIFTGKESIHLRFRTDPQRYLVDYMAGGKSDAIEDMNLVNWGRVVPGKLLGYGEKSSIVALYQPRRAGADLNAFLKGRDLHAAEMYRIKALAEREAPVPANALISSEYLASYSEQMAAPADRLFDFISDGTAYGLYTWGRKPRTKVGADTYRCPSDFGGADVLVRTEADRERKTVDYYVGPNPGAMKLTQSARVFDGPTFGYEPQSSLVTFTRWRAAGQSAFEWDRAKANQVEETTLTKAVLMRK